MTYDPETIYVVRLRRKVSRKGYAFKPLYPVEMKGKLLNSIIDENGVEVIDAVDGEMIGDEQ